MSETKSSGNGIGIGTVLLVVFMVLKLCHVITWSWWWVTAPVWIPVAFAIVFSGLVALLKASTK